MSTKAGQSNKNKILLAYNSTLFFFFAMKHIIQFKGDHDKVDEVGQDKACEVDEEMEMEMYYWKEMG
jgi:hypothetical protein